MGIFGVNLRLKTQKDVGHFNGRETCEIAYI